MELLRSIMKEAMSVPSVGSEVLGAGAGISMGSPPSDTVSFLCLMMILRLSWLGEGRLVALCSNGATNRESVCVGGLW